MNEDRIERKQTGYLLDAVVTWIKAGCPGVRGHAQSIPATAIEKRVKSWVGPEIDADPKKRDLLYSGYGFVGELLNRLISEGADLDTFTQLFGGRNDERQD